ncbi:hypothetical protein LINPERHAP1_LOCUS13003, partial [Linum perenne]
MFLCIPRDLFSVNFCQVFRAQLTSYAIMNYKFYIKVLQVLFKFIFKVLGQGISLNYC